MSKTLLLTIGLIFVVMLGGILVDRLYRRFAARHPECGPYRKEGGGCGICGGENGERGHACRSDQPGVDSS